MSMSEISDVVPREPTVRQRLYDLCQSSDTYMFFRFKGNCDLLISEIKESILNGDQELIDFFNAQKDDDVRYCAIFDDTIETWPDLNTVTNDDSSEESLRALERIEKDMETACSVRDLNDDDFNGAEEKWSTEAKVWRSLQEKYPNLFGQLYPRNY